MADASVSKTDEGNLVRVRLPLSAPPLCSLYSSLGRREKQSLGTKSDHLDRSVDVAERQASVIERVLVSLGLVLVVAVIYQLAVGGIRIEVADGRLTIDVSGLVYWWQVFTGAVAPHK